MNFQGIKHRSRTKSHLMTQSFVIFRSPAVKRAVSCGVRPLSQQPNQLVPDEQSNATLRTNARPSSNLWLAAPPPAPVNPPTLDYRRRVRINPQEHQADKLALFMGRPASFGPCPYLKDIESRMAALLLCPRLLGQKSHDAVSAQSCAHDTTFRVKCSY